MDDDDTADLVAAAGVGDRAALDALLERSWGWAYRLAWRLLRDREAAEDAAQEACARAVRSLDGLRSGTAYRAWFHRVAARIAVRSRSRTVSTEPIDRVELAAHARDVDAALDVNAAVDRLSETLRVPVVLYYGFDLSSAEIAQALGIPDGTVRWRLAEARRRLRLELTGNTNDGSVAS